MPLDSNQDHELGIAQHNYVAPDYELDAFNCPFCHAYATQSKFELVPRGSVEPNQLAFSYALGEKSDRAAISICHFCKKAAIWRLIASPSKRSHLLDPRVSTAPPAHEDFPEPARRDYEEAREVVDISPRAAAALLRLSLQRICRHLGLPGKSLNDDIATLIRDGLDERVQQALDVVRIVGNEAVHPGELDLNDNRDTALKLFGITNFVVQEMISKPRQMNDIYGRLPESSRKAIDKRNAKSQGETPS